jgi:hypothetical protein
MYKKIIKQITFLSLITFILHLIWENVQMPLYFGYTSFGQHFMICFVGTLGDLAFTLFVYLIIGLLKEDFDWISKINKNDFVVLILVGFLFAVGIEWRALLFDRWKYTTVMPIIPYFKVGLTPILQMIILLPLSIYLTKKFNNLLLTK